jgi:putative N6-adenine-specific DNA methylase
LEILVSLFFVSCPLDYETELASEIKSFWFEMMDMDGLPTRAPSPEFEVLRGGLQMHADIHLGCQINFFSKIANRVLLRVEKFEARYYDQYEKGMSKVDLKKYFTGDSLKIKIEHHKSRLNHEKNIEEATLNVFKKNKYRIDENSANTLYIRIDKDVVTLSLDTSGEHLHKRGYAVYKGEAPLRETLAAYMVRKLQKHVNVDENLTIIDPFAGSGTLLFEACSAKLPNFERPYAWLQLANAPKLFKSETWKKNYRWIQKPLLPECLAFDIDDKALDNLERNQIEYQRIYNQDNLNITTQQLDSRDIRLDREFLRKSVWALCNPPYGIRLADDQAIEVLEHLESDLDGLVVIHPATWSFNFKKLKLSSAEEFRNQGLNLKMSVFVKKV